MSEFLPPGELLLVNEFLPLGELLPKDEPLLAEAPHLVNGPRQSNEPLFRVESDLSKDLQRGNELRPIYLFPVDEPLRVDEPLPAI